MPRNNRNRPQVDRRMPGALRRLMNALDPEQSRSPKSYKRYLPPNTEATQSDWKAIERNAYAPWGRGQFGGRPTNKQPANRG